MGKSEQQNWPIRARRLLVVKKKNVLSIQCSLTISGIHSLELGRLVDGSLI